jgi:hypothetical protein
MSDDIDLRLFHIGRQLAEGVTDPAAITDALVQSALQPYSRDELLSLAVGEVAGSARSIVRGRNAEIERRATAARQAEAAIRTAEEPRQPWTGGTHDSEGRQYIDPERYGGKLVRDLRGYRHGSWAKKDGAARRGCVCEPCTTVREQEQASERDLYKSLSDIIKEYTAEIRMDWEAELLELSFAVDNSGRTVTWGAATVEQHRSRIEMLTSNALANTEAAARHQAAINDIEEAGATCLFGVVEPEAA